MGFDNDMVKKCCHLFSSLFTFSVVTMVAAWKERHIGRRFYFFLKSHSIVSRGQGWIVYNSYTVFWCTTGCFFFFYLKPERNSVRPSTAKTQIHLFILFSRGQNFCLHVRQTVAAPKKNKTSLQMFASRWIVATNSCTSEVLSHPASRSRSLSKPDLKAIKDIKYEVTKK